MKYLSFIPLLILTFTTSCKKEENKVSPEPVVFGNITNMSVQTFNNTIHLYNQDSLNIDVNNNGTVDLKFDIYLSTIGPAQEEYGLRMYSPSKELAVNGYFVADTTYSFQTSSTETDSNGVKVWKTNISNYSCSRTSTTDIISNTFTSNNKMWYYNKAEKISSNNTFSTEFNFPIWQGKTGGAPVITSISGDTTYLAVNNYNLDCHSIGDGEKYICFKMNDSQKLGWIKLKRISKDSFYLFEIAIQ